jgi:hypothetical protein
LECTVLPSPREHGKVFNSENKMVAEVRVTEHRNGVYVSANLLKGRPLPGQIVKFRRQTGVKKEKEEGS